MKNKHMLLNSIKVLMRISITQIVLTIVFAFNLNATEVKAQEVLDKTFSLSVENTALNKVFKQIQSQTGVKFVYSSNSINAFRKIDYTARNQRISDFLNDGLKNFNITYRVIDDQVVLYSGRVLQLSAQSLRTAERPASVVTGRVINDKGEPLQGVTVSEKGTRNAVVTGENGNYSINVGDNAVLEFTYVGYQAREIPVGSSVVINIQMTNNVQDMSEVIVVGYGTQRRGSVTGAVEAVTSKALEGRPSVNMATALQGTAANLIVQQTNFEPGQGQSINIRGVSTLGNNSPLVVIDGIVGGNLNLLNPNDIESVSVLKDAGTAAIYGSRSANGVLLITTKKGRKNEKASVTYSGMYGIQMPRVTYKPVDAWANAYYKNLSLVNSDLAPAYTPEDIARLKERGNGDWRVENIIGNAPQQSHNVSFRGGGANNTYMVSLGVMDQRSNWVVPKYGYTRYNARLNQSTEVGRFKVTTILSYTKVNNRDHSSNTGNLIVDAGRVPLYYNFQDSLGRYLTNPVSAELNPLGILRNGGYRKFDDDEVFGSLTAEFQIYKDLKLRGIAGGNAVSNKSYEQQNPIRFYPGGGSGLDSRVSDVAFKGLFSNLQLLLDYSKKIKRSEVNLLAGATNESYHDEQMQVVKRFTDTELHVPVDGTEIDPGATYNTVNRTNESSLNSYIGRAAYNFDNRYFAELSFRYDGSSKFPKDKRWGFFPSASAAWRVSQESFFEPVRNIVNDLKLRASYGVLGNQNVGNYQYQTTYFSWVNAYAFNNTAVAGSGFSFGNPDLTWEKAATTNLGLDVSLFKKFSLNFDYFDKMTSDILIRREDVPLMFGATFPDYNFAKVRNRGWEVKATYNLSGNAVNHSFSLNFADNLNELISLNSGVDQYSPYGKEEFKLLRRVGQPVTVYYGYKTNGYFQNLDQINDPAGYPRFANSVVGPGDLRYIDRNGDGVITEEDMYILGNPFPRYTYGLMYNMNWKGIDLQIFIQGVGKRAQMIRGEQVEPFHYGYGGTMYQHQTDFWTPTNSDARWPRLAEAGSASNLNNYRRGSDIYLFNAAYGRLKNVQLGYTLPQTISKKAGMQKARLYLTGQNLITISKLDFLDPEMSEFNNNVDPNSSGANSARAYFMPMFFGMGLDLTF